MSWLVGFLFGLVTRDAWGWLPALSRLLIRLQTAPLPRERREIRRDEWFAELAAEFDDRRLSGVVWALKLCGVSLWERITISLGDEPARWFESALRRLRVVAWIPGLATTVLGAMGVINSQPTDLLDWLGAAGVAASLVIWPVMLVRTLRADRAWRTESRAFRRLPVLKELDDLGYESTATRIRQLRIFRDELQAGSYTTDENGEVVKVEYDEYVRAIKRALQAMNQVAG